MSMDTERECARRRRGRLRWGGGDEDGTRRRGHDLGMSGRQEVKRKHCVTGRRRRDGAAGMQGGLDCDKMGRGSGLQGGEGGGWLRCGGDDEAGTDLVDSL
jgi:hypothetical protein